jgi:hypothetical protein
MSVNSVAANKYLASRFANRCMALSVVLLLLLGMIAIEPAEARRGGHRRIGGRGARSVMRGAGRISRGLSRSLLGGRRGHGGRRHRNRSQGQNAANPNPLDPNAVNGGYNNGIPLGGN